MLNFGNLAVIQYIFHVYQQFTKILFWWSSSKQSQSLKISRFEPQLPNFNTVKIFRFTESNM